MCIYVEVIWIFGVRMGGMQVHRQGGGEIKLSAITTQMFQGPFGLTDVRAHVGKHKTVVCRGRYYVFATGVLFSLTIRRSKVKSIDFTPQILGFTF